MNLSIPNGVFSKIYVVDSLAPLEKYQDKKIMLMGRVDMPLSMQFVEQNPAFAPRLIGTKFFYAEGWEIDFFFGQYLRCFSERAKLAILFKSSSEIDQNPLMEQNPGY